MFSTDFIWALIPLAPFMLGGLAIWSSHKRRALQLELEIAQVQNAGRASAMDDRLEQRVRTLERIVTDQNSNLSQQIEDLRDAPLN